MEFLTHLVHAFNPSSDAYLFMWAILLAGTFSVAIIVERFLLLTVKQCPNAGLFMKNVLDYIQKDDLRSAAELCAKAKRTALSQVVKSGLDEASGGLYRIRNSIEESMLKIVPQLEKRTGYLAVMGNVATLLGLLGTVYGLIMSFAAVGRPGIDAVAKSELLASGIATAMNSTFSGLSVAISAIVVYAILKAKTQRIVDDLDEYSLRLLNALAEKSHKISKYHISASQIKEGVGLHIRHNNVKIFTDNKLIKEVNF